MRPRTAALTGGAFLLCAAMAAVIPSALAAIAGCRVSYAVTSQWQGGFGANVTVTNLGDPTADTFYRARKVYVGCSRAF